MKLTSQQQKKAVELVKMAHSSRWSQLTKYKDKMLSIYKSVSTFKEEKRNNWDTSFKINKAFETENKILPRVTANSPKWLVSLRTDEFDEWDRFLSPEERREKYLKISSFVDAIRDYLTNTFDKKNIRSITKLRAKGAVRYGLWRSKVGYKYDLSRESKKEEITELDENGKEIKKVKKKVKDKVVSEYAVLENVKISELVFDPRHLHLDDFPGIIETKQGVRLSYFTKNKDKYQNIDKIIEASKIPYNPDDAEWYKQSIYSVTGIQPNFDGPFNVNELTVKKFYWLYEVEWEDWANEKLYEFWTINDMFFVYWNEITQIPFECIKCFEDTETFLATWFIEPIEWLQDEINFKKNSASHSINQALHRNFIWSANSWINPRHLNSAPWNIIPTTKDWKTAMENLIELPFRQIPASYFQEQNDLERQVQSQTFTIDTTTPQWNQALTNTATWIKVKAFETSSVVNDVRSNYEDALVRIAYKLLQSTFDNLEWNAVIKKIWDEWFWEINKEAMRDAVRRYEIKIEAWSSSFDSVEQRRSEAIAQRNISQQAAQAWVNVDLEEQYKRLMSTFDKVDPEKLIKAVDPMMPEKQAKWSSRPIPMPEKKDSLADIRL